jgi:hypothetical protein
MLYVDNILICSRLTKIEKLRGIMVELRERHSYLRMQLTIKDRAVKVEMRFYVEKILLDHEDYELI